jgi:hypothetical protein
MKLIAFLLILVIFVVSCVGCNITSSTTHISYETYKTEPDAYSLSVFNHPLFSLKYPDVFKFYDLNEVDNVSVNKNLVYINFDYISFEWNINNYILIQIHKPSLDQLNAIEILQNYISSPEYWAANLTIKKTTVAGIDASCLESLPDSFPPIYDKIVLFDYAGFNWAIYIHTIYFNDSYDETREALDPVLQTFKFLDADCANSSLDRELDVDVTFDDNSFFITNNEKTVLCEIKLFLNYSGDNLTSGFMCSDIVPIRSRETRSVQYSRFKDSYGFYTLSYSRVKSSNPLILQVQAQYAGCIHNTYSRVITWE